MELFDWISRIKSAFHAALLVTFSLTKYSTKNDPSKVIFVTASDKSHEKSLAQLLRSLAALRPHGKKIVFDLGLTDSARSWLLDSKDVLLVDFPFEQYPSWFRLETLSGAYAWKPQCLHIARNTMTSAGINIDYMVWLDAGCTITSKAPIIEALAMRFGVFGNAARGTIQDWTTLASLHAFEKYTGKILDSKLITSRQISAALLAFNIRDESTLLLLERWTDLALQKEIISPDGADKSNHRFDQSLISLLLITQKPSPFSLQSWPQAMLGFKIHQDVD